MRRLLVANRGEIAVRVIRAARDLGVETVAVYSTADRDARHVHIADRAVCIGPPAAADSYLRRDVLVHLAVKTGCDAVHPGYGFLSEDARFANNVTEAGLSFVGPTATAIEQMGDKAVGRKTVAQVGVPVIPGSADVLAGVEDAITAAAEAGYPVLIKAKAGGGGKGMRVFEDEQQLRTGFDLARREAVSAFGDGGLYLERYLRRVRHIEVQVFADQHGHTTHLGERDCSLQRRHQKVLEETPSPALTDSEREQVTKSAVAAARAVGYVGAGTVEFVFDVDTREFFFIEMNTRIQVEHPITEVCSGEDLVAWQLRVADGEHLTIDPVYRRGHAIECRINAEDWRNNFMPSPGAVTVFDPPGGPGVRVDTHCHVGAVVPPNYDSLLAKLVVHGRDRGQALCRARRALSEFEIAGVATTIGMHRWLLDQPEIVAGTYTTSYLEDSQEVS